jgi:hypothetical protein
MLCSLCHTRSPLLDVRGYWGEMPTGQRSQLLAGLSLPSLGHMSPWLWCLCLGVTMAHLCSTRGLQGAPIVSAPVACYCLGHSGVEGSTLASADMALALLLPELVTSPCSAAHIL